MRFSGRAPQLIGTKGISARRLWSCSARATSSLPVPVSPRISTVESVGATLAIRRRTVAMPGESPTRSGAPSSRWSRCFSARYLLVSSRLFGHAVEHGLQVDQLAGLGQVVERPVPQRGHGRLQRRLAGEHDRLGVGGKLLGAGDHLDAAGPGMSRSTRMQS